MIYVCPAGVRESRQLFDRLRICRFKYRRMNVVTPTREFNPLKIS